MNFIINSKCSKGCSFCFTKNETRSKDVLGEMTIEMVDELINHYHLYNSPEEITILGGEPTQHSNFKGILEHIFAKNIKVNIVSNFLFGKATQEFIVENIKNIRWVLPNASELNEKNRMTVFKKNYLEIYKAYANTWGFENQPKIYLSLTISKDWKERNFYEYVKWLYNELDGKVNAIRLGLDLTGDYLINNKEMGNEITKILKFGKYNNFKIISDCQVPPCLWEGKTKGAIIENSLNFATFKLPEHNTICGFLPLDIFADGSSIHCYPLQDKVRINNALEITEKNRIFGLRDEFDKLYTINYKNYNLPQDCLSCPFYKIDCNGICGGCLENSK